MASNSSGTSSGFTQIRNSGSETDLQQLMDQRKRKRMISNRESARRSRMKKQNHLDELMTQASQLRDENNKVVTNINVVTQLYLNVEAENSVLRAQMAELTHRLESLNEIMNYMNSTNSPPLIHDGEDYGNYHGPAQNVMINNFNGGDGFLNPWDLLHVNQPIMASADAMFMY